ncbi:hypothetical protein [Halomarina oriensis]|uniref:Uncharacterized protein n=1 Tax=Halomarina oriensis TaxID=671145 RepID=A0A6B0GMK4_9EURY|nr:hypothetical protein [Halomarina oriensis]MWG35984.1 hypothetical protein [Halomarina oriensis]
MCPHSRRSVLKASGLVASVPLAGCSVLDDDPRGVVLSNLVVRNATPEPRTVRLELVRDGELVHEGTHTVDGMDDRVGTVGVVEATWSIDPAVYELTYAVREHEPLDVRTARIDEESLGPDHECAVPTITLGFPEYIDVRFAVLGSDSGTRQYCPAAQTTSERSSQDNTTSPS